MCIELQSAGIPHEAEKHVPIFYRGQMLCHQRLDIVAAAQLILEIKSVEHLAPVHHAQLLSDLRVTGLPVGLLINFNVPVLQDGLKRIVL